MPTKKEVEQILCEAGRLNDGDLEYLVANLNKERDRRRNVEQAKDWALVRQALDTYTDKWGCITVYCVDSDEVINFDLHNRDMNTQGVIEVDAYASTF